MFWDYDILIGYARDFSSGVWTSIYPPAMTAIAATWDRLTGDAGAWLLTILSIAALFQLFRLRAVLWLAFTPILFTLVTGQIDILALWLLRRKSIPGWIALSLKPHLLLFALPDMWRDKRRAAWAMVGAGVLHAGSFAIWPDAARGWLAAITGQGNLRAAESVSLWSVPALALIALLAFVAFRRFNFALAVTAFNPTLMVYDLALIAPVSLWIIPLSWPLFGALAIVEKGWPMAFIGIASNYWSNLNHGYGSFFQRDNFAQIRQGSDAPLG